MRTDLTAREGLIRLFKRSGRVCYPVLFGLFLFSRLITVNISPSVPLGVYLKKSGPANKEDYVLIPLKSYTLQPRQEGLKLAHIKILAGTAGDVIDRDGQGRITVNGRPLEHSKARSMDSGGHPLTAYPLPHRLQAGEGWAYCDHPLGYDSRYLGPVDLENCKPLKAFLTSKKEAL